MVNKKLPHEIKSEETKKKLLDATERMLSQYDFKLLTVRNICAESGVAYGSFYHHFSSKENLLYIFTRQLFQEAYEHNPVPDWIDPNDYIKSCLWYIVVYGWFCQSLGRDLVKYLYTNCPQDMFAEVYRQEILPRLEQADRAGYIDSERNHAPLNDPHVSLLAKDLEITCKGVLLWWSNNVEADSEPLYATLEHLSFNMLYSYSSENYENADFPHRLLTESPQFEDSIKIDNIFSHKKQ